MYGTGITVTVETPPAELEDEEAVGSTMLDGKPPVDAIDDADWLTALASLGAGLLALYVGNTMLDGGSPVDATDDALEVD